MSTAPPETPAEGSCLEALFGSVAEYQRRLHEIVLRLVGEMSAEEMQSYDAYLDPEQRVGALQRGLIGLVSGEVQVLLTQGNVEHLSATGALPELPQEMRSLFERAATKAGISLPEASGKVSLAPDEDPLFGVNAVAAVELGEATRNVAA